MKPLTKIAGINLLILLTYSALIRLVNGRGEGQAMGILMMSAFAVGLHVFICAVIGATFYGEKNKELRRAWFLSMGIVLLIGFSTCLGNASL